MPLDEFDGVVIMTIHKSKGLEFDNVIVMDRLSKENADKSNILLMHAMGPNVAGVIGSAVAAGVLLSIFK